MAQEEQKEGADITDSGEMFKRLVDDWEAEWGSKLDALSDAKKNRIKAIPEFDG